MIIPLLPPKKVVWLKPSLEDLKDLPKEARRKMGYILDFVERREFHHDIKPLKGMSGVYEIRVAYDKDAFRTIYVINLDDDIYILHVFKKKSKQGSKLSKEDANVIQERLKRAKEIANERKKERERH